MQKRESKKVIPNPRKLTSPVGKRTREKGEKDL